MPAKQNKSNEFLLFLGGSFLFIFLIFIIITGLKIISLTALPQTKKTISAEKHTLPKDPLITPAP